VLKPNNENVPPDCFGLSFEASDKLCIGGYDPVYTDGSGSHTRPACNFSSACAARVQASGRSHPPNFVPAGSLVRPHTTVTPPAATRPPYPAYGQPQQPRPTAYGPPSSYQQPPMQHLGSMSNVPLGHYSMPQYLTVRETPDSGGVAKRLSFEILRSMGKSFGHTLANFFDMEIFGRPRPPNGQP
jgi:hypothetical protein